MIAPLVLRRIRPAPAAVAVDEGLVSDDSTSGTSDDEEKVR